MRKLGGRKIFLFGFIAVLLIGIPVTVYLVQRQQQTSTQAAKSTNLSFTPDSSANAPIQKNVGDEIPLDIFVDPGSNLVSFVKLEIQYDPEKLATSSANAFTQNSTVFPSVLEGPVYTPGKIAVTLSVGPDPTKAIQTKSKAATVSFTALSNTPPGQPTLVSYGATTQALSIGFEDQASENVLSSATPAMIAIGGESVSPTEPPPTEEPTPSPTIEVTPTPEASITPTISSSPSANLVPACNLLAVDRETTGTAPLSLTFTANGTDADDIISKVTFNFGDGGITDVTDSGGVGTASVSAQTSHTYNTPGTYSALAILADSKGGISDSTSCRQTVTVTASGAATIAPSDAPAPSLEPTGTGAAMAIGAVLMAIIIGGGFLFFFL